MNENGFETPRGFKEWLLGEDTPKTKAAVEQIFNEANLTENMIDSLNAEEQSEVKGLVGEYIEITEIAPASMTPEVRNKKKEIIRSVAELFETAFDREN
jgi:hypothetical protein